MTIFEAINWGTKKLKENHIEDSLIIVKELLVFSLKKDKQYLIVNSMKRLETQREESFKINLEKIISGTPIQYITNNQSFMNENYYVDENVLIPQPDTEVLVQEVINLCKNEVKILDLCTGSGAIAISTKKALNRKNIESKIFASDVSKEALKIARKNAITNQADIEFIESDLFESIKVSNFDIIVSNPPYIKSEEIEKLSIQVQNEPHLALDGGENGLKFYEIIAKEAYKILKNEGFLCLEIGYNQAEAVKNILVKNKVYTEIKVVKDLSKNDRCIITKIKK